jgi:hypothetical protein
MFDWYEPVPQLDCPVCGASLDDWQGSDADNVMFVWRQGIASPVDWRIDPDLQTPAGRDQARLPMTFSLGTDDLAGHRIVAEGSAPGGTWSSTRLLAVLESHNSRKGARFTRVLWGDAPWLTKATRDR